MLWGLSYFARGCSLHRLPRSGGQNPSDLGGHQHLRADVTEGDDPLYVCVVRFGGITHGNYMDQRFIWLHPEISLREDALRESDAQTWQMNFALPPNPTLFPPGHYMLFVLDHHGVPSIGQFVVIRAMRRGIR